MLKVDLEYYFLSFYFEKSCVLINFSFKENRMPKNATKNSSSSSSDDDSEDELIKQQLREATVSFEQITSKNAEKSQSKEAIDKKSKRHCTENENQQEEDDNSFNMTPEFQVISSNHTQ